MSGAEQVTIPVNFSSGQGNMHGMIRHVFRKLLCCKKINLSRVNSVCKSHTNRTFRAQFHPHEQFSLI